VYDPPYLGLFASSFSVIGRARCFSWNAIRSSVYITFDSLMLAISTSSSVEISASFALTRGKLRAAYCCYCDAAFYAGATSLTTRIEVRMGITSAETAQKVTCVKASAVYIVSSGRLRVRRVLQLQSSVN
jgi:hypothetical protein